LYSLIEFSPRRCFDLTAQMIVSEIGIDMTRFPTAGT
jgi:hypothetical protein